MALALVYRYWSQQHTNSTSGYGPGDLVSIIDNALWNSPGHHANIISTLHTHVGVGVAKGTNSRGQSKIFVTFNFYS